MTNEVLSKEMLFKFKGLIVARTNSFSFEINKEEIDITTLDDAEWKKIIAGMKSWGASIDGIITRGADAAGEISYAALVNEMLTSDDLTEIIITTAAAGDKFHTGQGLLVGMSSSYSLGEAGSWSGSISGSGALNQSTVV